jgi:hypothetical protein
VRSPSGTHKVVREPSGIHRIVPRDVDDPT